MKELEKERLEISEELNELNEDDIFEQMKEIFQAAGSCIMKSSLSEECKIGLFYCLTLTARFIRFVFEPNEIGITEEIGSCFLGINYADELVSDYEHVLN